MYDRRKCVGASDAVIIQSGEWAELYDRKMATEPPDYGLPAELGRLLEPFNLELFERETGIPILVDPEWQDEPFRLDQHSWCTYLPDGLAQDRNYDGELVDLAAFSIPVESKCINMMWKPENLLAKYMPQLQHAMRVMEAEYCWFSVLYLNTKYEHRRIEYDPPYDLALFEKEKLFQFMLEQGIRPPEYQGKRKGWTS